MKTRKQNTLTLIRKYKKSNFFIIFTCNPHWLEFTRDILDDVSIENRSKFCARIFQLKLKKLFRDLTKRCVLRQIVTHIYIIEFQKKNLSYAHILLVNDYRDDVKKKNVNYVVQTIIFSQSLSRVANQLEIDK